MTVEFKIDGLDAIKRKIGQLPQRIGQNAARRALRKGANLIRDAARINARRFDDPTTRENVAKNVTVKGMKRSQERAQKVVGMRVGIMGGARLNRREDGGKGAPGGNTTYWRFLEFGTSDMAAQPFMRPAMESKAGAAFQTAATDMLVQVDKELAKLK